MDSAQGSVELDEIAVLASESAKSAKTATCPRASERMSTMTLLEEACPFFLGYGQQLMMADETSLMLDTSKSKDVIEPLCNGAPSANGQVICANSLGIKTPS